jgi:tetraacyldisaccharide-1-P 4'-kinase
MPAHSQALVDEQLADAPRFGMCRRASELLRHGAYPAQRDTPDSVAGVELGLLCGIANPASLRRSVEELGGVIVAERLFADHHRYRARDLRGLAELAPRWITTEKDAVKILPAWSVGVDLRVLRSELEAEAGEGLVDWVERRIAASASLRPAS